MKFRYVDQQKYLLMLIGEKIKIIAKCFPSFLRNKNDIKEINEKMKKRAFLCVEKYSKGFFFIIQDKNEI